jgi:outer membrane protein OmpA-like peptidoglycan-associated protein
VKALENELAAAQAQVKELTDKNFIETQQDIVPALNQQIATLRDQITELETGSSQMKKNLTEATATLETRTGEAEAAEKKAQALLAEKESLQQSLNASQAAIDDLKKQLEAVKVQQTPAASASPPAPPSESAAESSTPDADKDGVSDAVDLCPDSPAGSSVNALGCPAGTGIVLEGVSFDSGTAVLTSESRKNLDQISAILKQVPQIIIEVAGYTDSVGEAKRNLNLSVLRSETVVKYLTDQGVAAAQLTAKGYGSENPIADNTTQEGRRKNRRIELHLLDQ